MVKSVGLIVEVFLPGIAVAVRLILVLIYPRMQALNAERQGQDQQQAVSSEYLI